MSEITKLYKNAGIEQIEGQEWVCKNPYHCTYQNLSIVPENCSRCKSFQIEMIYPPFTTEKQLNIIKFLGEIRDFHTCGRYCTALNSEGDSVESLQDKFEESLAGLMNLLWKNLTSEEKQQVKGILK